MKRPLLWGHSSVKPVPHILMSVTGEMTEKSAVMLSSCDVQTYMLKTSSEYTAKVKNMTPVGSNKSLCIKLEFIQVVQNLALLLAGTMFPMLNFQLFIRPEGGKVVFFHHK